MHSLVYYKFVPQGCYGISVAGVGTMTGGCIVMELTGMRTAIFCYDKSLVAIPLRWFIDLPYSVYTVCWCMWCSHKLNTHQMTECK